MEWSPWFSWWMDLVKFAVTFGTSALLTVFVVNRYQNRRARRQARAEALFHMEMAALTAFRQAMANYEVAAAAAYTDVYQWSGGDKTPAMQRYEGQALGDALSAIGGLHDRFRHHQQILDELDRLWELHGKRHALYDAIVDYQLDAGPGLNLWDEANANRKKFDRLLDRARTLRRDILHAVEDDILEPE